MDETTMKNLRSLSTAEIASLMGVDRKTVNLWQDAAVLPYFVAGSKRRTLESDVKKFVADGGCDKTRAVLQRELREKRMALNAPSERCVPPRNTG